MKTLGMVLSATLLCMTSVAYASKLNDQVVPVGPDTYSITREAGSAFTWNTDKLKEEAQTEAEHYAAAQGKQVRILSVTSKVPKFSTGYAWVKIVFKALPAGDPGLSAPLPTESPAVAAPGVPAPVTLTATTDDLYNALLKLDDLRKKGILTDEEFQAEKKKILSKSN